MQGQISPWSTIGPTSDPTAVWAVVSETIGRIAPEHDLANSRRAIEFVTRLFAGEIPGYQRLQTRYHNLGHTLEVLLCSARILEGMAVTQRLDGALIDAVLIGAALHDSGYVCAKGEGGTGAQFTANHVERGIALARIAFGDLPEIQLAAITSAILTTDPSLDPDAIDYHSPIARQASMVLATADIVGQMANREYIERLLFLYAEFREAGIGAYRSEHDLLENTIGFSDQTFSRLYAKLDGMVDILGAAGNGNTYLDAINRNLAFLQNILMFGRTERLQYLRRGKTVTTKVLPVIKQRRPVSSYYLPHANHRPYIQPERHIAG